MGVNVNSAKNAGDTKTQRGAEREALQGHTCTAERTSAMVELGVMCAKLTVRVKARRPSLNSSIICIFERGKREIGG